MQLLVGCGRERGVGGGGGGGGGGVLQLHDVGENW